MTDLPDEEAWRCERCGRIKHESHEAPPLPDIGDKFALCNIHHGGHVWREVILHVESVEA